MTGPSFIPSSAAAFLPGAAPHSCQSGRLRAASPPSTTEAGGSCPPLFAMPANKAAGLIFEISWTGHLSFAASVNSDAAAILRVARAFEAAAQEDRARNANAQTQAPETSVLLSRSLSISDPYPRTIESAVSIPLISLQVNKSIAPPREAANESQALHTVSLSAVRLGRPLRSRSCTSPVRDVRPRTGGERQALPTQGRQEAKMRNSPQYRCNGPTRHCAICDGRFGLIRHYSWRTAFCSKKCANRFKVRQEGDRRWLHRLQAAI